jgi:hypothetical protein
MKTHPCHVCIDLLCQITSRGKAFLSSSLLEFGNVMGMIPLSPSPFSAATILVADDNLANLELLSGLLQVEGYEVRCMPHVLPVIRHHHEKLDGSGYPDGLKGADPADRPHSANSVDIYDALTTSRPYRKALSPKETFTLMDEEVERGCGMVL